MRFTRLLASENTPQAAAKLIDVIKACYGEVTPQI
jgi:hypothetical protein